MYIHYKPHQEKKTRVFIDNGNCPARDHKNGFLCTREKGHKGHHMAGMMGDDRELVVAAEWDDKEWD